MPSGEVSQPVQGRFGVALVKVGKIEPGTTPTYEGLAAQIKKDLATERARAKVAELHNKMEDERGGGAGVVEAAQKLGIAAGHHRGRRSFRPHARRPAGGQHSARARRGFAGLQQRCRRRERPDPIQRRLCLVRRAGHHAVARTQSRRGQGPGRGALARRPDLHKTARQGDRNRPEAGERRQARRYSRQPRSEGRDRGGIQSRCVVAGRAFSRDHGSLPHAEGRCRTNARRRRQPVGGVPCHRCHCAADRHGLAKT